MPSGTQPTRSDLPPRCLVTGATGYVGGRLVPELLRTGYRVRVMARSPAKLLRRPWYDDVENARAAGQLDLVRGSVVDP